jgi:hypothetical protein
MAVLVESVFQPTDTISADKIVFRWRWQSLNWGEEKGDRGPTLLQISNCAGVSRYNAGLEASWYGRRIG